MHIWTFEFICQFIANLAIVSQSMKTGPIKLMIGPRNMVTNQGPALWETSPEWSLKVSALCSPLSDWSTFQLWYSVIQEFSDSSWDGVWGCLHGLGMQSDQMSQGTWRGDLGRRPWTSFSEHNLLKKQNKILELFWKQSARSFPSIFPFLIFFKIRKVGRFCNAPRKTFKLVEKSHSIGVFKSITLWGWYRGQGEKHTMRGCFWASNRSPTLPCGKPSEIQSNAQEPSSHGSFQSATWKWRNTTGLQSSSWLTPILLGFWSQKEVASPLPWEPPLWLTGIPNLQLGTSCSCPWLQLMTYFYLLEQERGPGGIPGSPEATNPRSVSSCIPSPAESKAFCSTVQCSPSEIRKTIVNFLWWMFPEFKR